MNFVVTGGAGFIGANVVAALMRRYPEDHITVIDSFKKSSFKNIQEACRRQLVGPFNGTVLTNCSSLPKHAIKAVFHLGAMTDTTEINEGSVIQQNSDHFAPLLEECINRRIRLVYASSAAVYGNPRQARSKEPFPLDAAGWPLNVYGFSKWLMEKAHERSNHKLGIVGLRYFNVFGPGESRKQHMASMIYQLAMKMHAGGAPVIFEDGEQARDHIYIDDVVECTIAAAKDEIKYGIYNVGTGIPTTFNTMVDVLRKAMNKSSDLYKTDHKKIPLLLEDGYQSFTCADISATIDGLKWKPKWTFEEAVKDYVAYLGVIDNGKN